MIGLKNSYFPLIHLPSCYRTVCYWTVCYRAVKYANHIQSCSLNQPITFKVKEMDNKFKFKTIHVSIVQRSSSVVNAFTSSVELIQAMAYKLKRNTIQNFEKINVYCTILRSARHGITLARALHLIQGRKL